MLQSLEILHPSENHYLLGKLIEIYLCQKRNILCSIPLRSLCKFKQKKHFKMHLFSEKQE